MRWILERVTQPEIEPISVAEFVRNVGEFQSAATARQTDIEAKITAAREWAENYTGRALIDQEWLLTLTDQFSTADSVAAPSCSGAINLSSEILLRRSPVISVVSFKSVDSAGDETEIDAATYELREEDSKWPKLVGLSGASWGSGTFRILFRAGYADQQSSPQEPVTKIPARIRQAVLLYAEALYDKDEKMMGRLIETAENLLDPECCDFGLA